MIRININGDEREVTEINDNWIHDRIQGRVSNGEPVCVIIRINHGNVNVSLSAGECHGGSDGGRIPNSQEEEVISLWYRMKVSDIPLNSGKIVAFLAQMKRI